MNTYVPYHVHTDISLLDSCSSYEEYIDLAVKNGIKAISFSEHGKPLNWTEKWGACKRAGIKYLHSVEIYLTETLQEKVRDNYHTVLIAKNMDGVRELNSLVSKSCDKAHFHYTNRLSFEEFINISNNIITTSACLASPLNKLQESNPWYIKLLKRYDYLEIQPHLNNDQIAYNKRLYELSKRYNKPLIAGTDTHSSSKYKAECRSVLLSSKHKTYGDEDTFDLTFKTFDELVDLFNKQGALPEEVFLEAINNTNIMSEDVEEIELDTTIKYPILYGSREADEKKMEETVSVMFKEKLDKGIITPDQKEAFENSIEDELRVFKKLGMMGFMLSMSELIRWCKSNGMAIGTARGSVGGSRVAYITDIIDLNPETWHTVFSRFCNEDRVEIGDIDTDCIESDRPAIFQYITERFGKDKTARVASFGTIKSKGVIDDVGRHLALKWANTHAEGDNPWSLKNIARIKDEFDSDEEKTKSKYPELFYYYDGMINTKISQSVHPAGMVISPITLYDNYGVFDKDGESCLMLDMENIHDYTGLAKYDFLILKTVQVIRDTCKLLNEKYPLTHEIDWNDTNVWENMITSPVALFQFESPFAFDSLRKFAPKSIFDMSIVTACIRPSGTSYRSDLLSRRPHSNPSDIIDDLLKDNLGYLIYQEDTIKFLQQICGLSGSEADNIRRAIGRKQKDRLDKAMPSILEGYCKKSSRSRNDAEEEAKEFLKIIEDSADYQFGYNHSIAYCLLGYLCAYYRYYHPVEFITSFLNNAANDEDIKNGTAYANKNDIHVTMPKWGLSKECYVGDSEKRIIAKGLSSVKYMSEAISNELYNLSKDKLYVRFIDLLKDIEERTSVNSRQIEILIKIDFFSDFGNQNELLQIYDVFDRVFNSGNAKKINKEKVDGTAIEDVIRKYSVGVNKDGGVAKSYTILDIDSAMSESEDAIKNIGMSDFDDMTKAKNFADVTGYIGYVSGKEEDRRKLYIMDIFPLVRKRDNKQFGYSIVTKSIGSGKEGRFTVLNSLFNSQKIKKGNIIFCKNYEQEGKYFKLTGYEIISEAKDAI